MLCGVPRSLTTHIDSPREVGRRLKAARERAGLSQRQLAFPGCTAAYISRLEAGARVPSLQMVNQLAVRLDVSGQWLATGVEVAQAEPLELVDAEVALRLGDLAEAERIYRAHLQPDDPSRAVALAGLGQIAFRLERYDEAIAQLEQAFGQHGSRLLSDPGAVESLGRAYAATGVLEQSIALFRRALDEARSADAPVERLRFSVLLANALIDSGGYADAERTLADVIALTTELRDPLAAARVYWSQSRLHSLRGEAELAARYARRALDIVERTENDAYVGMAHHLLAFAEIEAGRGGEALDLLARGRELFGDQLAARDDAKFALEEARALVLLDRTGEAAKAASRALELIDAIGPGERGRAYVALGDVFLSAGDDERARMLFDRGFELLLEAGKPFAIEAARRLADLLEADGDTAGALEVLKRATEAAASPPVKSRV